MATSYMDYTAPTVQFTYDVSDSLFFKKNDANYINVLSNKQLNTLTNTSLLDIYLSTGNVVEPHYHQNASELVYCIAGAAVVSILNPFTNKLLSFSIGVGQVANVPQGWWHYEIALEDNTHLLAIFDAPVPEVILGSDILRLTPANVLAHTYCLSEEKVKDTLAPITSTVLIGPPNNCKKTNVQGQSNAYAQQGQMHHGHGQMNQGQPNYGQMSQNQANYVQPNYGQMNHAQMNQAQANYDHINQAQMNPGQVGHSQASQSQSGQGQSAQGQIMPGVYQQRQAAHGGLYNYPHRPIDIEPFYDYQPFYPIPYLFHR
ncbi:cupin domain-containing protein [Paenibacillus sp. GSMTC-2017]|nr:cupin domain-containing protein [Paenibacillus sp. GSMTC-2017]